MTERRRRNAGGRPPTAYTEERAARICDLLAEGVSLTDVCKEVGVPRSLVHRWVVDDHEGFAARYARARHIMALGWADELMHIADDRSRDYKVNEEGKMVPDYDVIQRSRLRVDTRKWILAKMLPKVYGDKVIAEVTGKDGAALEAPSTTINVLALEPEQRAQLKQILLQATKGKTDEDEQ